MFMFKLDIIKKITIVLCLLLAACASAFLYLITIAITNNYPGILIFFFLAVAFSIITFIGGIKLSKVLKTLLWKNLAAIAVVISCINFFVIAGFIFILCISLLFLLLFHIA